MSVVHSVLFVSKFIGVVGGIMVKEMLFFVRRKIRVCFNTVKSIQNNASNSKLLFVCYKNVDVNGQALPSIIVSLQAPAIFKIKCTSYHLHTNVISLFSKLGHRGIDWRCVSKRFLVGTKIKPEEKIHFAICHDRKKIPSQLLTYFQVHLFVRKNFQDDENFCK